MRKKLPVPFSQKFPNVDPLALCLLERLLAFDPKYRPTAEEVRLSNLSDLKKIVSNALKIKEVFMQGLSPQLTRKKKK